VTGPGWEKPAGQYYGIKGGRMFGLGMPELIVIMIIVILVFGAGRISEIGGSIGKGIKNFKKAMSESPEIDVTPPSKDAEEKKKEDQK
jgi:sec-independent protein translocase protein TatA